MGPRRHPRQLALTFATWGGRRRGAGRKPKGDRPGVSHHGRSPLSASQPVHVTIRLLDIGGLRTGARFRVVRHALALGAERPSFRLVQFSVMSNHLHLICEADSRATLSRGLQGLLIRIAKALNRHLGRSGRVFADRYHDRTLRTPSEVRAALAYVLNNARRHATEAGRRFPRGWVDPCSSASEFTGWSRRITHWVRLDRDGPLPRARTWLLRQGWKRAGPLDIDRVPG